MGREPPRWPGGCPGCGMMPGMMGMGMRPGMPQAGNPMMAMMMMQNMMNM